MNRRGTKGVLLLLCSVLICAAPAAAYTAPHAAEQTVTTYQNLTTSAAFAATEEDSVEYQILSRPTQGTASVSGATFRYTPYQNRTGQDRFTYLTRNAEGVWGEETAVEIEILPQESDVVYQDLAGHPAEYAAVRLAEAEVYAGASYGGRRYFLPDESITRAEFLTMTLTAADIPPIAAAAEIREDDAVPAWADGYLSAALASGMLTGRRDGECTALAPDAPITWAEAAVLLAAALDLPAVKTCDAVPVWAAGAWQALTDAGYPVAQQDADAVLTRGDAARLLLPLLREEEPAQPTGLFSWTTVS